MVWSSVWILAVLAYDGHLGWNITPTLEFKTQEKCEAAIKQFEDDSRGKRGKVDMRCVRIEK
ncbi:MAG: hypothetical protein ACYDG4_17335 [Desulfuromonadaceae bacterium]|jgi:hypothetical protein